MMLSVQVPKATEGLWKLCEVFVKRPEEQENSSRKDFWKLNAKFLPFSVKSVISMI